MPAIKSPSTRSPIRRLAASLIQWVDADYTAEDPEVVRSSPDKVDLVRCIPFLILHLGCLGAIWTGISPLAVALCIALYFFRMFAVTGIYHRYFSHKTYHTSRFGQFVLALWGATTVQRGALWWAYHHRHHHQHSDDEEDAHSPHVHGFLWSHIGWITSRRNFPTDYSKIKDLAKFPELVFLNRFDIVVPILFATGLFSLGKFLSHAAPGLHTSGSQLLVWGFFISTTLLFHGTACINSLAHLMGKRRFKTDDDSRNSFILSIITLGEGWHNNHHRYQSATRNGFYWWEIDITYYGLKLLSWTGFIWDFKPVPESILEEGRSGKPVVAVAPAPIPEAAPAAHSYASMLASAHHKYEELRAKLPHVSLPHPDVATLKRVMPAAAAIAIAGVEGQTLNPGSSQTDSHGAHIIAPGNTSGLDSTAKPAS